MRWSMMIPFAGLLTATLTAADPAPTMAPLVKLDQAPVNEWVRIAKQEFGLRNGAAVFYSEGIEAFVVAQGVSGDAKRKIACPYDVQVFYPKTGSWENRFPPGKEGVWGDLEGAVKVPGYPLSSTYFHVKDKEGNIRPNPRQGFPNGFAVSPDGGSLYLYARGYRRLVGVKPGAVWRYDVKARTWSEVSPEHRIDVPSHGGPVNIVGGRLVYEPVKNELLLLGGQAPNVIGGSVGNWAFSLQRKTWRQLAGTQPPPRATPAVAFDPVNKAVVLFGGDHFDYVMNDTWLYDPSTGAWREVSAERAPSPRANAALVWLPKARKLALVGGRIPNRKFHYYDHYDPVAPDVWTFDVKTRTWALVACAKDAEGGKGSKGAKGAEGFDWPTLPSPVAVGPDDLMIGLSHAGGWPRAWQGATWAMKVDAEKVDEKGTQELGVPTGSRISRAETYYRTGRDHHVYDPKWYDAAPPGDPKKVQAWLDALKPNTWTEVPRAPRHVPESEWGTAVYDPERDQIYYWTGGHMSDPANAVHTYHPAVNRWSIPYVAEIPIAKGITFNNRPDCKNHTYHNYAFDPVSKRIAAATYGGTGVYDPDTGSWTMTLEKPFRTSHYTMNLFTTPKGILVWAEGFFGRCIVEAGKGTGYPDVKVPGPFSAVRYEKWPVKGKLGGYLGPDATGAVWDPKRKVIWMMTRTGWRQPSGQVWSYDLDTHEAKAMNPVNMKTLGQKAHYLRELVYLPKADLVLLKAFMKGKAGGRQLAYDPTHNRWVHLNIEAVGRIAGPVAMIYDSKRDLVWCMAGARTTYVLKVDPDTLDIRTE